MARAPGTEQGMAGGQSDNDKRQPLWQHGGYNQQAPLYQWTRRLVSARKAMLKYLAGNPIDDVANLQVTPDGNVLSFVRGSALAVVTRRGFSGSASVPTPFRPGTQLCDELQSVSVSTHVCDNSTSNRQDCGHSGTEKPDCEAAGCCWSPIDPNPGSVPWCFYPTGGPPGPPPSPPGPPPAANCIVVGQDGSVQIQVNSGLPKVYILKTSLDSHSTEQQRA